MNFQYLVLLTIREKEFRGEKLVFMLNIQNSNILHQFATKLNKTIFYLNILFVKLVLCIVSGAEYITITDNVRSEPNWVAQPVMQQRQTIQISGYSATQSFWQRN